MPLPVPALNTTAPCPPLSIDLLVSVLVSFTGQQNYFPTITFLFKISLFQAHKSLPVISKKKTVFSGKASSGKGKSYMVSLLSPWENESVGYVTDCSVFPEFIY